MRNFTHLMLFAILLCLTSISANATIRYVKPSSTSTAWSGQTTVYTDINTAITASTSGDEIWVAAGTYKPTTGTDRTISFSLKNGVKLLGGFTGTETSSSARNWNTNKTILSGDIGTAGTMTDNSYHVVSAVGTSSVPLSATTILDGFIIEKGYSNGYGGGVYCQYASLVVQNCLIRNNYASSYGGGIYGYSGSPSVINCIITQNKSGSAGAGICADSYSKFNLVNITVTNNTSTSSTGGIDSWGGSITGVNLISWGNTPSANDGSYTYSCVEGGSGTGITTKDPQFIDAAAGDFRLNIQSPCIDKGSSTAVPSEITLDFMQKTRIQGDAVDMGALEGGIVTPIAVSPSNNSGIKGIAGGNSVSFSWKWATGATPSDVTGYKFQYWTAKADTVTTILSNLTTTVNLTVGQCYFWRVGAVTSSNLTNWGAISLLGISHLTPLYVKQGATGDGTSWASAYGKLQIALSSACYGDEVWVAAGTYKPAVGTNRDSTFLLTNGVKLLGGFAGTETASTGRNWDKNKTILSGDVGVAGTATDNSKHVVSILGSSSVLIDSTTVLDGFVIEKGYASNGGTTGVLDAFATNSGGGICCAYASPVIQNCLIRNNYATEWGGGIFGDIGSPKVINCILSQNKSGWGGGGLMSYDGNTNFKLINVTASGNSTTNNYTGGLGTWNGYITGVNVISYGNNPTSNNGAYTYSCIESGSGTGVFNKDPLFIDANKGDFRLNAASPCINKGNNAAIPSGVNYDIALNARIQKDTVDLGALEGGILTPIGISPANNSCIKATLANPSITFSWKWASGTTPSNVTGYKLQYWTTAGDTTTTDASGVISTLTLSAAKQYYWRVRAIDGGQLPNWSPIYSFSTSHNGPLYVKQGSNGDGSSWSSAFDKLQNALKVAVYGDEIWVAAGTYKPATTGRDSSFSIPNGVKVLGGFAGTETSSSVRNWNTNKTILSGDIGTAGTATDNSYHVVSAVGTSSVPLDATTILDGFIIEKGYSTNGYGGGLYCQYASLVVQNCLIRNNYASSHGGGVYGYSGSPSVINCIITQNKSGSAGAGICADSYSNFNLVNITVTNNTSTSSTGGIDSWGGNITGVNLISWGNIPSENDGSYTYSCVEGVSGTGVINKDPLLIDASKGDFRLNVASPCINKGSNAAIPSGVNYDIALNARIQKDTVDIGAYEGGIVTPVPVSPANNSGIKSTSATMSVTFSWKWASGTAPSNVTGYKLQYWTASGDTTTADVSEVTSTLTLSAAKQYYWRVRAIDGGQLPNWSPIYSFSTSHTGPLYVKQGSIGDGSSWSSAFNKLQDALKVSLNGDEIWVAAGTYKPAVSDRDSSFSIPNGVNILGGFAGTETSSTARNWNTNPVILSGDVGTAGTSTDNSNHVVQIVGTLSSPVDSTTILDGFIIEKGYATRTYGGGIYCYYASPKIQNCIIRNNYGNYGGGIYGYYGNPQLTNCIITQNTVGTRGGALYAYSSNFKLVQVTVNKNIAKDYFGGIYSQGGTITGSNNIIWGNTPSSNYGTYTYSCIEGGSGTGVIDKDPLFIDAVNGDFRLNSKSPCINKGSNAAIPSGISTDIALNARIQKDTVDMGACEGGIVTPVTVSPISSSILKGGLFGSDATFTWKWESGSAPTDVTGYKFQYWKTNGDTTTVNINDPTSLQAQITLANASVYNWRVGSITGANRPNWSSTSTLFINHYGPLYVKQGITGGDGSSWKYAYDKLQTALKAAFYGDEIWVAAGTYYPAVTGRDSTFSVPNGVTVLGGFAGTETASSARKWVKYKTILSGDIGTAGTATDNSYHVVTFNGSTSSPIDTTTTIDGFIIEKGYATSNNGGGGIYSTYASPKIQNCLIRNNYSTYYGGGIYGYNGNPKLINCVLIRNTAVSGGGGLVADDYSKFMLINVTVSKNSSGNKGGIYSWGGSISGINTISYANKPSGNDGSYTYSCIEGLTSGTGNINKYPMFVDTLNNDFHLKAGSPCIDAGNNTAIKLTSDMNSLPRISFGKVDMGAYESAYPKVTNPQNLSGINPSGGIVTYRWTLGNSNEGNGDPYSSASGTSPFSIKVWNKTDNTKVFENTTVNAYALPSMNYTYGTGYQWQVGTVTDDYTYWSDTTTFYIGKDHPVYVKQGATGDGTSWDNAMGSVKDALEATIPGDEIWVAAGTYYPTSGTDRTMSFTLKPYVSLLGGFAGTENFKAERNCTKNVTILSGDIEKANDASDNSNHVIYNKYTQASPLQGGIIDGFVITAGNAGTDNGGAMYNEYASPTIYNCIFRQNQSVNGGAIANISSSPLIYNSLFYSNQATTAGGAVYNDNSSASKLINCTVSSNTATTGGGVSGPATIGNSIIYGNGTSEIGGTPTVTYSCVKGGFTGTGNVSGDPDFVSTSTNDFRLGKYSSCFNKGSNSLVPADQFLDLWNHEDRIFVSTVDIGAYELNILEVGRVSVDSISPAKNATITDLYAPVTVYFNRPVSIKDASEIIMAPNNPVISITLENGGKQMAISPTNPWNYSTPYKISIPASSLVLAANELIGFSKDSALFTIRACIPAKIKFASTDTSFCPDIAPILSVSTTGEAKTDYQWSFNGTNLSNDGKASWTLTNFSNSQVGTYVCSISDLCGNTTQGSINVTLNPKITYPVINKKWSDVLFVDNSSQKFSSYQWALNGNSLNLSSQYITMSSISGTYEVSVLDAGSGCRVKSSLTLASQQKAEISMYPNPAKASQSITVNFGQELESGTIKLYNLNGSLVFTAPFSFSSRYILEHTNLNSGVYILEVTSNGISNKSKLIIEK